MDQLFNALSSPGAFLAASLIAAVGLLWIGLKTLVSPSRDCDCPRHLLRNQSGKGLRWKTFHQVDCERFGS